MTEKQNKPNVPAASNEQTDIDSKINDTSIENSSDNSENSSEEITKQNAKNITSPKDTTTVKSTMKKSTSGNPKVEQPNKISKTAILALILAIIAAAGVAGVHYFHALQNDQQSEELIAELSLLNNRSEQRLSQLIAEQKSLINEQVALAVDDIKSTSEARIEQLSQQVARLEKNQPSDWLIHEAEYLIRIASRTIWLKHDTRAAVNLLNDADARIKELNDPQFLPVRQLIREDIERLKLMPTLQSEEVILNLLTMTKQIPLLQLSSKAIMPEESSIESKLELTDNIEDWRSNLGKTWDYVLEKFITIRRHKGNIEPLLSPIHQQNLLENMALKIQQAQWAVSEEKQELYLQTLGDIQAWLGDYFDLGHLETAKFYQGIEMLKSEIISYDYPSKLVSLKAIRSVLAEKNVITTQEIELAPENKESSEDKNSNAKSRVEGTEPVKQSVPAVNQATQEEAQ